MSSCPTCSCLSCPDHSRVLKDLATRTCPSSLSDAQWELIAPLLPAPASSAGRGRRPEKWPRRLVLDAVFYVVRGGIPWHALPAGFPPGGHRLRLLRALQPRRVWRRVHDALREQERAGRGRDPVPTAAVTGSQSVQGSHTVPRACRGYGEHRMSIDWASPPSPAPAGATTPASGPTGASGTWLWTPTGWC